MNKRRDRLKYPSRAYQQLTASTARYTRVGQAIETGVADIRRCVDCGSRLASDNRADRCGPCARTAVQKACADEKPDEFWDQPTMRDALRSRHFGRILYAYRHEHRPVLTQARIGRWLGLTQGQVSRLERDPEPADNLKKLVPWARSLRIPERHLWFRFPDGEQRTARSRIASGNGSFGWFGATTTQDHGVRAEHTHVASVREMTDAFRKLDNRYGGGHARSMVAGYLSANVVPLLREGRYRHEVRRELAGAVAELGQLAGWMAYDMGDAGSGRLHLRQSLRLCQEVGDDALAAEMLAGMSHHAAFYRESLLATDLARAAKNSAARTRVFTLVAESAVMEAHGLAQLRDRRACVTVLGEAERAFSVGKNDDRPAWLGYFDSAYLAAKFAHCFRDLDRPVEAERFARRSLEMSEGYDRGRLFNTALLASVLADQRRVEEACETGSRAVALASDVQSVRVTAYLRDVAQRLARYRNDPQVQALYDEMAAVGVQSMPIEGQDL